MDASGSPSEEGDNELASGSFAFEKTSSAWAKVSDDCIVFTWAPATRDLFP
jgi:hypothetical protein